MIMSVQVVEVNCQQRQVFILKEKKKKIRGGKHNFPKLLGMESVHPKLLEEFQEGADLHPHVTF